MIEDIRATHYISKLGVQLFLRKLNNKLGKPRKMFLLFKLLRFLQMKFGFWFNFIVFLKVKTRNKTAVCYVLTLSHVKLQEVQKELSTVAHRGHATYIFISRDKNTVYRAIN